MPSTTPPKFDGLNAITTANNTITVHSPAGAGGVLADIPVGDYFIHIHTGTPADTNQLIERLDTAIETVHGGGNASVTVSDTTGLVTINNLSGVNTLQVDWTDTGLRDLLGFTGANTGVIGLLGAVTGTNAHRNGWYPTTPPRDLMGDPSLVGIRVSDTAQTTAPSGRVVTTKFFEHVKNRFEFQHLVRAASVPVDSTVVSWEQWWQRIGSAGIRFRYYPSRSDRDGPTGAGPFTYVVSGEGVRDGSEMLTRSFGVWADYYDLAIDVREFVA